MKTTLIDLQYFQEMHDRKYHVDIHSKPLMARLTHLHNHLIKYNQSDLKRVSSYQDAIAIIFSMANALNLNLSFGLEKENQDVMYLDQIKPLYHISSLKEQYNIVLGEVSKLLEGFDHVESLFYKESLKKCVVKLLIILMQIRSDFDELFPASLEVDYIQSIFVLKKRSIFFARYHDQDLKDPLYRSMVAYYQNVS